MSVKELKNVFLNELKGIYIPNEINSLFKILCEKELNYSGKDLLLKQDEIVNEKDVLNFFSTIKELKNHKPIQYIIGETDFYGLKIKVSKDVLIPRPETEELVDWILSEIKHSTTNIQYQILDIGTGSGCIAIALKKNVPDAKVSAIDISEKAIEVAKENSKKNNTEINFLLEDIFRIQHSIFSAQSDGVRHSADNIQYSIIVSNPPYVKISEKGKMQKNVLDFEPHQALFVEDENPLKYYEAIINFAKINLKKNGFIYFEINETYAKKISDLLLENGFSEIEVKIDLSGKNRMIRSKKI